MATLAAHAWRPTSRELGFEATAERWPKLAEALTVVSGDKPPIAEALDVLHGTIAGVNDRTNRVVEAFDEPVRLLWWAEAGWSDGLLKGWDEIDPPDTCALVIVDDFAAMASPTDAATSFLLRTLRKENVNLDEKRTISQWIKAAREGWDWIRKTSAEIVVPEALADLVRESAVGLPATATRLGLDLTGVPKGTKVTSRDWYLSIARERLLSRHVFGGE